MPVVVLDTVDLDVQEGDVELGAQGEIGVFDRGWIGVVKYLPLLDLDGNLRPTSP